MNQIAKDRAIKFAILLAFFMGGFGAAHLHKPIKHTGPCTLVFKVDRRYWFKRPNNEVFEMSFDNTVDINAGVTFSDIAYQDDGREYRYFVAGKLTAIKTNPGSR
jgi:hypothetical protein